uniref:UDP-N-acetylglucosamine 2-epimerase (non-hydrolyzing) n=1 Tax=Schlesneria paludicola TaxID=360056 RepID=A0A7C2K069_9PLAN
MTSLSNSAESRDVCLVVGTRPEVVKMAPVYVALRRSQRLRPVLLSTGQHRQMLDQALAAFGLTPDDDLDLMQPGQTLTELTSRAISRIGAYLSERRPAAVLVQGDTTTVLSTGLAAFYHGIPVGHVEAGLRTGNLQSPWPEEMNRRLVAPLCRWHFAPTEWSRNNLLAEGIPEEHCHVTGNPVVDALRWMYDRVNERNTDHHDIAQRLGIPADFADAYLNGGRTPFVLVTGHRRESFGGGLERVCEALQRLVARRPDVGVLFPVHLNPAVRGPVRERLADCPRIALTEPADYHDFVWLMGRCRFLISDSGGVQEEAPCLGKPVLVTRNTTERPEGVEAGTCRLVGTDPDRILQEAEILLSDADEYCRRSQLANPYGDGRAAERIASILEATV